MHSQSKGDNQWPWFLNALDSDFDFDQIMLEKAFSNGMFKLQSVTDSFFIAPPLQSPPRQSWRC